MKRLTSRQKILLGCFAMVLCIVGDYLLGFGTIGMNGDPDAFLGVTAHVVPDWRYALSSVLGFACVPFFACGALELLRVMEKKYRLQGWPYRLFKAANWGGIFYFAFIHIGICMLPVVFNAGMEVTGDVNTSLGMALRVAKSIAVPMAAAFLVCDGFVTIAWTWMVLKGMLPVPKAAAVCSPLFTVVIGQLANVLAEGLDSGFESLGWFLIYLVCAVCLTKRGERIQGSSGEA